MEGLGEDLIAKWGEGKEKTLLYYTVNSSRTIQTDTRKKKKKMQFWIQTYIFAAMCSGHYMCYLINRTGMILTYCEKRFSPGYCCLCKTMHGYMV